MAQGTRICKICGKEYEYCKTNRPTGLFRWQDVACSPEHAEEYFAQIAKSRAKNDEATTATITAESTEKSASSASKTKTKRSRTKNAANEV